MNLYYVQFKLFLNFSSMKTTTTTTTKTTKKTTTTTTTTTEASTETTTLDREKQMLKSAERSSLLNRKPTRKRVAGECNDLHGWEFCLNYF